MNKSLILISGVLFSALMANAQNEHDALNISNTAPSSTALSMGMGGVGGSMGGDFNSLSINPAGIGVYRAGELTITPSLRINNSKSTFDGNTLNEKSSKLSLDNIGFVIQSTPRNSRWRSVSFGFGMNTLANYNITERAVGTNFQSSISDIMSAHAMEYGVGENAVPPYGYLGYEGYLLADDLKPIVPIDQGLTQDKYNKYRGHAREYNFTLGGNYNEKLHLGIGMGITTYDYSNGMSYIEKDETNDRFNNFSYAELMEQLNTTGIGFNAKFGAIFVPTKNIRLGASIHTPTWTAMTDDMDYQLVTNTETYKADEGYADPNPETTAMPSQPYQFSYGLQTPWKLLLSGTILGNMGMISADYEYSNFANMQYNMRNDISYASYVNNQISNTFQASHTLRVGGEVVLDNVFLRAGGAYQSSPYQDEAMYGGERLDLTAGAGMRWRNFFIDLGYMHRAINQSKALYNMNASGVYNPQIQYKNNNNYVSLTLGFKFRR